MMDMYGASLADRDACLRVSGQVPRNGEAPKDNHVRPVHWPGVRDKLAKAGYEMEVGLSLSFRVRSSDSRTSLILNNCWCIQWPY